MNFFMVSNHMFNLDLVYNISVDEESGIVELFFINGFKLALVNEDHQEKYDLEGYEGIAFLLDPADFEDYILLLADLAGMTGSESVEESGEEPEEPEKTEEADETGKAEESKESEA